MNRDEELSDERTDITERFVGELLSDFSKNGPEFHIYDCPICRIGNVKVEFEEMLLGRGSIFYSCTNCDFSGHISIKLPK